MADVQHIIEGAVRAALQSIPVDKVDVALRPDHSDEEAYYVVVDVPPSAPQVGGQRPIAAIMSANDALLAAGDRRFPYIRIRYLGEEADEGEPARASGP